MHRHAPRLIVLSLLFLAATAASAETFTVTLTNGTTFETRYRPVPADWDENIVLIHTDRGNWIGLLKDEVADVTSKVERSGFGYQLDTTTLFLGWSPNDVYDEPEEGEEGPNLEEMYPEPEPTFTLQQFVDIPQAGQGTAAQVIDPIN